MLALTKEIQLLGDKVPQTPTVAFLWTPLRFSDPLDLGPMQIRGAAAKLILFGL